MVSGTRNVSPGHARRARLSKVTRPLRRASARSRTRPTVEIVASHTICHQVDTVVAESGPVGGCFNTFDLCGTQEIIDDGEEENVLNHEIGGEDIEMNADENSAQPIFYGEGNFSKVKKYCLSIRCVYPVGRNLKHCSTLPLFSGECKLHYMGTLSYSCTHCGALAWKDEGLHIQPFVGQYCCMGGKVKLPCLEEPPIVLRDLLLDNNARSKGFRRNIRAYNNALAFASLGAHIDERFCRGGVYTFRVHGSIYHSIGALMPHEGFEGVPRFAQLYFYDTEHELENRLHHLPSLDRDVLHALQTMIHQSNPYADAFRSAAEMMRTNNHLELRMVIKETRSARSQYSAPTASEVAAIMPGQGDEVTVGQRDVVLNYRDGGLKRISNLHPSYMPLLYVLLFPKGEDGWYPYMPNNNVNVRFVTQKQHYAFRLQVRQDTILCLLRGGRLLQQYIVDAYSTIEESRLLWVRNNQKTLRSEVYQGLADMVAGRDGSESLQGRLAGRRIILPGSFTGGPRYMYQLYQDAMGIVRKMGKPDLFITFTCNPKWKEIVDALLAGQTAADRPDITSRVFYQKYKDLMQLLIKRGLFGTVVGHVSVIEFQKRGLPHAHILLILSSEYKPTELVDYDKLVCAELPDQHMFPELYDVVSHCNVHGPCGPLNPKAPCMHDGKCRFHYPRSFCGSTTVDKNGYPTYMRRDDGSYVRLKNTRLDNQWIAPYNPFLSLRYKAHINVEVCSTISAVKYLYKYVYKGHDRATVMMQDCDGGIDEINSYLDARYISASEACWRIYHFDMNDHKPDVQRLQVHLPMQNNVTFQDSDNVRDVVNNEDNKCTTLTGWLVANQTYAEANDLLYIDFPTRWVWNKSRKCWTQRQKGNCIGRMYTIRPTAGEQYFLRVLLTVCKGCKSFEDIRTVEGHIYPTFKAACFARGLLQEDDEWFVCMEEAAFQQTGMQLRQLFVVILVFCEPMNPGILWERFGKDLSEDLLHALQMQNANLSVCENIAKNQALANIEYLLQQYGKRLIDFAGLPQVDRESLFIVGNGLLAEEIMFDKAEQSQIALQMKVSLNSGQQDAYNQVLLAVCKDEGDVFFLDGPGGSGKTYLYNALLTRLRGEGKVALACASSGIAALLLNNGRTTHSRFKIPLELHPESTCNIKVNSQLADLLKMACLIIWDEAPMTHRHAFEALDRTMKDIMQSNKLFGGKVVLFGGDFRQVLPVVPKGSRADIVNACLCHSYIWQYTKHLKLSENMRVLRCRANCSEREFSSWLLNIGDGMVQSDGEEDMVVFPSNMMLPTHSLQELVGWVYKDLQHVHDCTSFFKDRGVLAPRNKEVDAINNFALGQMLGECKEYLSADSVCSSDQNNVLYTVEYLNSLNLGGGYPPHALHLKQNAPIILLRNLNPRQGLCNGTRLICKQFHSRLIEAEIITGTNTGERVFIPRITFVSSSTSGLPFEMRRRQFPVKLAFGMTINKAQGQTLGIMGLYLATPVFSHGQLYVAMSRVRSSDTVKVVLNEHPSSEVGCSTSKVPRTLNVVYKEVLQLANA